VTSCRRCNASVATGLRFCGLCGNEVADPTSETVAFAPVNEDPLLAQMRLVLAGQYEIEKECGRGGMGAVFKAMDVSLRRPVALKVMLPGTSAGGGPVAERLRREARRAAALDHPNIVPIYQVGESGGIHYIVMKFIEGRPLDAIVEGQGALPIAVIVAVLRATASALAYAHERGTVHRDIKSSNILIDQEGRVYVSDFGLARAAEDTKVTPSGAVIGTPQFMSPEQCAGREVGPQGDQYSLGMVAFHMLAGTAPFEGSSVLEVVQHHYFTPAPDVRHIRGDVPEPFVALISRLVAKDPAHRFINTNDLLAALEALPFHAEDQRIAKDLLRRLARGYRVPIVETTALPPLPDARDSSESMKNAVNSKERGAKRRSTVLISVGVGAAILVWGAWYVQQSIRGEPIQPLAVAPPPPSAADSEIAVPVATRSHVISTLARPLPAAPGRVRVRAEPADAVIFIDGREAGIGTVFDLEVPAGTRRLQIKAPGSTAFDTTFHVVSGNTTRLGLITLRDLP
jgi:serine/threonine protein kinase